MSKIMRKNLALSLKFLALVSCTCFLNGEAVVAACNDSDIDKLMQETLVDKSKIRLVIDCGAASINPLLKNLDDDNETISAKSAYALGALGVEKKILGREQEIVDSLSQRLKQAKKSIVIRESIVYALGNIGKEAHTSVPILIDVLMNEAEDNKVKAGAAYALGSIGSDKEATIPALIKILKNKDDDVQARTLRALEEWGEKLDPVEIQPILNSIIALLQNQSDNVTIRRVSIEALKSLFNVINYQPKTPNEINQSINIMENVEKSIHSSLKNLENDEGLSKSAANVLISLKSRRQSLIEEKVLQYSKNFKGVLVLHVGVWMALVFLYPRFPKIQGFFFWNPWMRRFFGAGYVGPVLVFVPFLRKKLFEPFRDSLLADADLSSFNDQAYFPSLKVISSGKGELKPLPVAIPQFKGQIILEGGSGLGKTMFLRHLCKESKQIVVYLLARRCQDGVIEAIQKKLHGEEIKDPNFLRHLIYSGAVAICIDGLNEVNADTRAKIVEFAENYFKGDIILSTQPMDWRSPTTAKKYVMQPLDRDQIQAFLLSRAATLPHNAKLTGKDYEKACIQYLADMLGQPKPELEAMQRILSNPMDLSMIALMLAAGEWPHPFGLQKQLYGLMAKVYEEQHLCPFPLEAFSEVVYQMRLDDKAGMTEEEFRDEISCLAQHRMVVPREVTNGNGEAKQKWYFRHDKIAEFFILQALISHPDRQKQHLSDPRFRGVYFMLASFLDLEDAKCLRELLIQHAADTKDHTVSDEVIQLLREREGAIAGHP